MTELLDQPAPRQTRRYERRREQILDAAATLFNARGLCGTTLSDVARAVGLTTTSITYYHRKKEDLAAACLLRAIGTLDELITEAMTRDPTPAGGVRRFLHLFFGHLAEAAAGRAPHMINFWDLRALTGPQASTTMAAFVGVYRRVRTLFQAPSGPVFTRAEQNARGHLVLSAVIRSKGWIERYEPEDYPRVADRLADILLHGLAADAGWRPRPLAIAPPRQSDEREVSREAFLRAATALVNEFGYRGASVDRISARLNVTKGSFYHHNETKDELVAECFARTFDAMRRAHRAALAEPADGWTRLASMTDGLVRYQLAPDGPLLRLSALSATVEARRPGLLAELGRLTEKVAAMVADGIADGSIRPVDPTIAGQVVSGAINAAAELARWTPSATAANAGELFARPLARGIFAP